MIHRVGFRFSEVDPCHAFEEDRQLRLSEVYASQESGDVTETILCIIVSRLIAVVTLITFITYTYWRIQKVGKYTMNTGYFPPLEGNTNYLSCFSKIEHS